MHSLRLQQYISNEINISKCCCRPKANFKGRPKGLKNWKANSNIANSWTASNSMNLTKSPIPKYGRSRINWDSNHSNLQGTSLIGLANLREQKETGKGKCNKWLAITMSISGGSTWSINKTSANCSQRWMKGSAWLENKQSNRPCERLSQFRRCHWRHSMCILRNRVRIQSSKFCRRSLEYWVASQCL